ncbi:MAG TPA: LUD domain-containing protein [Puia sp.]|jgi:L-lactate dehydrogenase complex protein LldG|nr:LUD domain-containing protein [Puia sp.]
MKVSPAKENILKKIRQALIQSTPIPFPQSEGNNSFFEVRKQELEIEFAEKFTKLQGKFIFCTDENELLSQLSALITVNKWTDVFYKEQRLKEILEEKFAPIISERELSNCDAAITFCESLIARTGSIVMSAAQQSGRTVSVYAPVHICIAYTHQLVYDIKDGLEMLKEKYQNNLPSLITFASGPSRTADIEKTLVVGVHGPKEVYVFLVDQQSS